MGDTEDKPGSGSVAPSWQHDAAQSGAEQDQPNQQDSQPNQLEIARRFLQEAHIKASSREKKVEFLKSKGLQASDIEKLLGQEAEQPTSAAAAASSQHPPSSAQPPPQPQPQQVSVNDRPPIVTYPEFLVKPERPPPLVTKNGIISTLYAFAGLSTILYGTSKYLIGPMVDDLTDARTELHQVAARKLDTLLAQLEKTVSVIPSAAAATVAAQTAPHDGSDDEDPTEMFHRDVGTQTALLINSDAALSPAVRPDEKDQETPSDRQADRLTSLNKTLSVLKDQFRAQSEGLEDIKTLLDVFHNDLYGMTYGRETDDFVSSVYDKYGSSRKKEPEDEIRKVRDNIRRFKGLLLSTRYFPASTR
ncbi:hypothetical protein E4U55_004447 [Claviceps digitariae]|nr:hypothetical protein E4U55_004447 [Claviceps digitariae]